MKRSLVGAFALVCLSLSASSMGSTQASAACGGPVVMMTTDWCGFCRRARSFFQAHRIPFKEYDVEKLHRYGSQDVRMINELRSAYGRGVPLIMIGNDPISGFQEAELRRALCLRG